jgi:hypothetical protein
VKAAKTIIAWTAKYRTDYPNAGQVKVGPFVKEGDVDWIKPYASFGGAAYADRLQLSKEMTLAMLFVDFHTLVVRDGIDPQVAHQAFWRSTSMLRRYRQIPSAPATGITTNKTLPSE